MNIVAGIGTAPNGDVVAVGLESRNELRFEQNVNGVFVKCVAARLAGREVRFVAILEHRSTVESRMALRLWRYSGEAWAREAERRGPLPDVVPLVVYAGKRPWTAPRDLAGLLAPTDEPALTALRPRFTYLLEDLTQRSPDTLRVGVLGVLGALALAWSLGHPTEAKFATALVIAAVLYDVLHLFTGGTTLLLGACRGLVYLVAALGQADGPWTATARDAPVALAVLVGAYVAIFSVIARGEAERPAPRMRMVRMVDAVAPAK
jgi:hypothetical protein